MNTITWRTVFDIVLTRKKPFVWGQIITLFAILISVPVPLFLPMLVDEVVLDKPASVVGFIDAVFGQGNAFYYVALVAGFVIFLRFMHFVLTVFQAKIFTAIAKFVTFSVRQKMIHHLTGVAMTEYERLGSGAIGANLVTDVNTLDNFIATGASKFIASLLTLVGVGIVMLIIHPLLGAIILFFQPIVLYVTKKISKSVGHLKRKENEAIESFQQDAGEVLELFGQIKASNKERYFFSRTIDKAKNILTTSNEYTYKSIAAERFSYMLFLAAFEIFRAAGLLMVVYSDLSVGMMLAMFGYIWFVMGPMQDIFTIQYSYASADAALKRINKVLTLQKEPQGVDDLQKDTGLDVRLENLSFAYNDTQYVLKDINLEIKARQKVAIIGASGSGKTTLGQIIAGFYAKTSGDVLYNNQSIDTLTRASIRSEVFLVLQMPILFNDTLRFNITMGNEAIDDEAIFEALKTAQLLDTVNNMPQGLDTIVGRHGIRLSGGQRQRLAIARMILANPKVVIFDESTSALDVHTEAKLFVALQEILKNKTVITIAHRLSTVKNADTIYVLDGGTIAQKGTHEALAAEEGHYYEFIKRQSIPS